jgi:hypothetical protein
MAEKQVAFRGEKSAAILRAGGVLGTGAYSSMAPIPPPCHHRRLAAFFRHCEMQPAVCRRWTGLWPDPTYLEEEGAHLLVNLSEEVDCCSRGGFVRKFFVVKWGRSESLRL